MRLLRPILTLLSSILGVIGFFDKNFENFTLQSQALAYFVILVLFAVGLIDLIQHVLDKKTHKKHLEATSKINQAVSRLIYDSSEKKLKDNFTNLLNEVSGVYSDLKKTKCVLTIKMLVGNNLVTIAHSYNKETRKREHYYYYNGNTLPLSLATGTCSDISHIYSAFGKEEPRKVYYYSKNLIREVDFHHPGINDPKFKFKEKVNAEPWYILPYFKKEKNWLIKYKSTVVVPVAPMIEKHMQRNSEENGIIGLLCINSKRAGVFNKSFDLETMQNLAELIRTIFLMDNEEAKRMEEVEGLKNSKKNLTIQLGKSELDKNKMANKISELEKKLDKHHHLDEHSLSYRKTQMTNEKKDEEDREKEEKNK